MSIDFLIDYFVPVIAGIALCICFVIRKTTDKLDHFIPLIAAVIGLVCSLWVYKGATPVTVLAGLFSGLAATGLYEAFTNLIEHFGGEK